MARTRGCCSARCRRTTWGSREIPEYWERIQKLLIRLEQQATLSKEKLQEEFSIEIVRNDPEMVEPAGAEESTQASKSSHPDGGCAVGSWSFFSRITRHNLNREQEAFIRDFDWEINSIAKG